MVTQQIIENAMPTRPSTNSFNAEQSINKPETHDSRIPANNKENKGPILKRNQTITSFSRNLYKQTMHIMRQCNRSN